MVLLILILYFDGKSKQNYAWNVCSVKENSKCACVSSLVFPTDWSKMREREREIKVASTCSKIRVGKGPGLPSALSTFPH